MAAHSTTRNIPTALQSILLIGLTALAGCSSDERVSTAAVLANTNCKGANTGLSEVSLTDVARFRGTQLLAPDSSTPASSAPDSSTIPEHDDLPLFISMSRGVQPSRGFELHLADQARVVSPTALSIDVYWSEPDTSKSQPLVSTNPCLVVSVPNGPWQTIEAIDQHGVTLGTLKRTAL